jgi:hypothetical protein
LPGLFAFSKAALKPCRLTDRIPGFERVPSGEQTVLANGEIRRISSLFSFLRQRFCRPKSMFRAQACHLHCRSRSVAQGAWIVGGTPRRAAAGDATPDLPSLHQLARAENGPMSVVGPGCAKKASYRHCPQNVAGIRAPDAIFLESVLLTPRCAR